MARLGASGAALPGEPSIPAEAHGIDAPRPVVEAPALTPEAAVHTSAPLATTVTVCDPEGLSTGVRTADLGAVVPAARRVAPGVVAGARGATLLRLRAHSREMIAAPRARAAPGGGEALRLRTVRRARVPWQELGRERKSLEPVTVAGAASYGAYVRLAPKATYNFLVRVKKPGAAQATEVRFQDKLS